jgi:hypothetical protein
MLDDGGAALPGWQILCVVCAASALTVVILGTRLTFFHDDWFFLLQRPGLTADSVLAPHNGHLSALAVLLYKALVELFGLDSQLPFRIALAVAVATLGVFVYLLVSPRAGKLLGLAAATIVVFLGPAWEDLLWSFQIGLVGSLATGLAALFAMEHDSHRRNRTACLLLVCSISLSDGGLPFVVAAGIAVLLRRRPMQLWIPAPAAVLFAIWWVLYGSDAPSSLSHSNLEHLPGYVLDSVAVGLATLTGLNGGPPHVIETRGYVLLAIAAVGVAAWWFRGGRPGPRLLVFVGAALTFWGLAGANYIPGRQPYASRYQLIHATLVILIAAELLRPLRPRPWLSAAVVAGTVVVLVSNLGALVDGYRIMRRHAAYAKTNLGALEITRGLVSPDFRLVETVAHNPYMTRVTAQRYFEETRAHGSPPAYSPQRIATAPQGQRLAADSVLAAAYGVRPTKADRPSSLNRCPRLSPRSGGDGMEVPAPPGGASITNLGSSPVILGVRRFAPSQLPLRVGTLGAGSTARIPIPRDSLALRWHLTARGSSALRICPI